MSNGSMFIGGLATPDVSDSPASRVSMRFAPGGGFHRRSEFEVLSEELLAQVAGGADPGYNPSDNALGRVGPGRGFRALGNYYTPEALAHDRAVRDGVAGGSSRVMAHARALPKLPAAVGSYFRARFNPGPNDMHLPD